MTDSLVGAAIARVHRDEWARVVASLARRFGDLDLAEDAAAEAFVVAVERWPQDGVPPNPGGWLTTTATRRAIDRLRLVFICCHPALAVEARVALTLRLLGGLTVAEIARAFLVQESTMAQRITRAKMKIKAAHIPFRVPSADDIRERLGGVLAVIFLVFNEGYLATSGEDPMRVELTEEANWSPSTSRTAAPGTGSCSWRAMPWFVNASRRSRPVRARGRYQLLAAISAVHTFAPSPGDTDWAQIVALYDRLVALDPSPIVRLNRAVAVGERDGADRALMEIEVLGQQLEDYHPFHATRAELLRRLGRSGEARTAYARAIELAGNPAERAYLTRRREGLSG